LDYSVKEQGSRVCVRREQFFVKTYMHTVLFQRQDHTMSSKSNQQLWFQTNCRPYIKFMLEKIVLKWLTI